MGRMISNVVGMIRWNNLDVSWFNGAGSWFDYFLSLTFQQLAAIKAGGLDQENQQHRGKRRHLCQRGVDKGTQ